MIGMNVILRGDAAWPDLDGKKLRVADPANSISVAVLDGGMSSGRPSVALRIDLLDGSTLIVETSARLFASAGRMISAKYPDLFEGD
jgi:hypothetical protein